MLSKLLVASGVVAAAAWSPAVAGPTTARHSAAVSLPVVMSEAGPMTRSTFLGLAALTAAPLAAPAATVEEIAARSNAKNEADKAAKAAAGEEPVKDNKESLNL